MKRSLFEMALASASVALIASACASNEASSIKSSNSDEIRSAQGIYSPVDEKIEPKKPSQQVSNQSQSNTLQNSRVTQSTQVTQRPQQVSSQSKPVTQSVSSQDSNSGKTSSTVESKKLIEDRVIESNKTDDKGALIEESVFEVLEPSSEWDNSEEVENVEPRDYESVEDVEQ